MAARARLPFDKLQAKAGFTEAIDVVEEIKCTNAQIMDLASLKEAIKLHTLDLRNIEGILDAPALRNLNLSGSPVSKMPNYRSYVVAKLPLLQTLDGKVVTLEERQHAQRLYPELATAPPADSNFVTPITTTTTPSPEVATPPPKQPSALAAATPTKPKITHTELSALFSSDPAAIAAGPSPASPATAKTPADFDSLFAFSSPAKTSSDITTASTTSTPAASPLINAQTPKQPAPSPLAVDLFAPPASTKSSAVDLFASQAAKQKKADALELFFSSSQSSVALVTPQPPPSDTFKAPASPFPNADCSDDDAATTTNSTRPPPTIDDPDVAAALADLPTYYFGCPTRRRPVVMEANETEADSCVTCEQPIGLQILKGQFDLSVAVLMGKAMASHPQAVVAFSSSFRFPLTLSPPPPFIAPDAETNEQDSETSASTTTNKMTETAEEPTPSTESNTTLTSASPSPSPSTLSSSSVACAAPTLVDAPNQPLSSTIDTSAWFALSDETKFALALEAFLSGWQGCAWAGDARFEMTNAQVPAVVVSISPIDVQVVPESSTQTYMCNIIASIDWMLALVSCQISKDAPLPKEVRVIEAEAGDWKRFVSAFEFSKKGFAAAQAALKRRDEENSGLLKEREDVELCLSLLSHSYCPSRWTGSIRIRIQLKSEGGQDITRTVILPPPKIQHPRVTLLQNWDPLVAPILATLTLSSDAWFDMVQAKSTVLNMLFDKRIQTDNIAGLIKFANSFTFGEKRYAAYVPHYKAREGKVDHAEAMQILTAADEHSIGEWFAGLVKKGMDSSIYLYERFSQPSSTHASSTSPPPPSSSPPPPTTPLSPRQAPASPPLSIPSYLAPSATAAPHPPAAAVVQSPGTQRAPPPASALRDLDKCVDELLQIATEKQGHTEAEQALLIEKLKAYIEAQKRQEP